MKLSLIALTLVVLGLAANGASAVPTVFGYPGESPWWNAPEATSYQADSQGAKGQVRARAAEQEGIFNFNP